MGELHELDVEALCAALPGANPTGPDPRQDFSRSSRYYRLRDARAEARAAERTADAAGEALAPVAPQWAEVRRLARELLATEAKDLEVAAWCAEALLRSDGLAGLAAGVRLMTALVETHWDALHPMRDEEGTRTRVAPVAGLSGEGADGTLIQPLRKLQLYDRADGTPVAFWQYTQSAEAAAIGDVARREQRLAAGVLPFETIEAEAQAVGARFAALLHDATEAAACWDALAASLEARAGAEAPSTVRVRDLLAELCDVARRYASAATETQVAPAASAPSPAVAPAVAPAVMPSAAGEIGGREDALRTLESVADYFRRTEPHSPLAYTLREAVRRARLTWPELLDEIVPDPDSRAAILSALGIRPPSRDE
jgi:type VI secretion system protein ImpA